MIPAKDIGAMILKDIQAAVREELGPDATADEIRKAEWALVGALAGGMFTARMG